MLSQIFNSSVLIGLDRGLRSFDECAQQNRAQLRWLFHCLFFNVVATGIDKLALIDGFVIALAIRMLVLDPLILVAIFILRRSSSARFQSFMTSLATVIVFAVIAAIGQYAIEPFATRYMMVAIFMLFSATLFSGVPLTNSRAVYFIASGLFACIALTSLRMSIVYDNIDLIILCFVTCGLALRLRIRQDEQKLRILTMSRVDADRSELLNSANRELERLANTDPLTELFNRRFLDNYNEPLSSALVPSFGYCVLMIDVDHFKLLNDYNGHQEGDRCLRRIANAIRNSRRSDQDIAIRYGGEEFAVILPDTDGDAGAAVAERIRVSVVNLGIPHPAFGQAAVVSVSIGLHSAKPAEPVSHSLRQADAALYVAKQSGRNRVATLLFASLHPAENCEGERFS